MGNQLGWRGSGSSWGFANGVARVQFMVTKFIDVAGFGREAGGRGGGGEGGCGEKIAVVEAELHEGLVGTRGRVQSESHRGGGSGSIARWGRGWFVVVVVHVHRLRGQHPIG